MAPGKERIKRKNTSPIKKISFSAWLEYTHQQGIALSPFFAPVISFLSVLGHILIRISLPGRSCQTKTGHPPGHKLSEAEAHQVQGDCVLGKILCYNPLFTSLICSFTSYVFNPQISQITQITLIT